MVNLGGEYVSKTQKYSEEQIAQWQKFAKLSKGYLRPPHSIRNYYNTYVRYTKDEIVDLLNYPDRNEKGIRNASIYLYNISNHYRRLINFFAKMSTLDYYLAPVKIDNNTKVNDKTFRTAFKKASDQVELMNLKHELLKVMVTCFREDVFYGYEHETKDSYYIEKLNPDYCRLSGIEDGIYTFEFDFSYFTSRSELLPLFPSEFQKKYEAYKKDTANMKWQELDTKKSVCFKLNEDLSFPIPPFAGTFPDIYDIADYKDLMKAKTETGNYKLLYLKIPFENGEWTIPEPLSRAYYEQLGAQLPEQIGLGMGPMDVLDFDFDKSGSTQDSDSVVQSENAFWRGTGVTSAILGKDNITSSGALNLSIETDAAMVYAFLRQIERWINKKLKLLSGTYHFKLTFLNTTIYNRSSVQSQMLQACQYGLPLRYATGAAFGISQADFEGLSILETQTMDLPERMVPVSSSHTQSSSVDSESTPGRPKQDLLDESGEATEENDGNDR